MSAKQRGHERQQPVDARDEFAWRAFCYLHGELAADEAEAFEEDLAVEQPAREALAQVVRLSQVVGQVSNAPPTANVSPASVVASCRPALRLRYLVRAAIAACLALMVAIGFNRFSRDGGTPDTPSGIDTQAALAEAWLDAVTAVPSAGEDDNTENGAENNTAEDVLQDSHLAVTVPSYYLALVDPHFSRSSGDEEAPEINQ